MVVAFEAAAVDESVRVVGLTGAGDAFCAGADLAAPKVSTTVEETIDLVVRLVRGIRIVCEKPVVAGIDGLTIGAGLSLALCADMRVGTRIRGLCYEGAFWAAIMSGLRVAALVGQGRMAYGERQEFLGPAGGSLTKAGGAGFGDGLDVEDALLVVGADCVVAARCSLFGK